MNAYYTHQETLIKLLNSFDYSNQINCLEFGSGDGSSSIFFNFATFHKNLNIQSFEHDSNWVNDMKSKYELENYSFNTVNWNNFDYNTLKSKIYDLIFVDQGDWDSRITTIDEMKNYTKYIILHDYCYYNGFGPGMIPSSDMVYNSTGENSFFYKYSEDFDLMCETDLFPPTLIFKNKKL